MSAAVFTQISHAFNGSGGFFTKGGVFHVAAHGLAGGVLSEIQGGKFGHGFLSAGLTKAFSPAIAELGTWEIKDIHVWEVVAASVIGGTISELSGGKFVNGAVTAAFANAFNEQRSRNEKRQVSKAAVIEAHNELVERILSVTALDSNAVPTLTIDDLVTTVHYQIIQAHKIDISKSSFLDYLNDMELNADTWIFHNELSNTLFHIPEVGHAMGGDINYIGVGVMSAHYRKSFDQLMNENIVWNTLQTPLLGTYNISQIIDGGAWANKGHRAYRAVLSNVEFVE